jgi:nucleoside-diphosphate-sugar epimerase
MMSDAIIGYTGFIGSNLIRQAKYDDFYNSQNIASIAGKSFDLLVCTAAPAEKWRANKEAIKDKENLQRLIKSLQQVAAKKVVLISTVDVYLQPVEVNEDTSIISESLQPYGKHRLELEIAIQDRFDALVVRLPGLFGRGIKKNIVYDFLYNNLVDKIDRDSVFQFYNLEYLWRDIQVALKHNLNLVNFAVEPTSVAEVAAKAFGFEFTNQTQNAVKYDIRTKHYQLFNSCPPGYLYSKSQVLSELKEFVADFKNSNSSIPQPVPPDEC